MKGMELNQVQRLRIYRRIGFAQFAEKVKICLRCINEIGIWNKKATESVVFFCWGVDD